MSFVAAGTFVVGAETAAAIGALGTGLIGGALVGAGAGALYNGVTGRSVLNGALYGGLIGGAGGALGGAFAGAGAGAEVTGQIGADISSMQAAGATSEQITQALIDTYGMTGEQAATTLSQMASTGTTAGGINMGASAAQQLQAANMVKTAAGADQQYNPPKNPYSNFTQTAPAAAPLKPPAADNFMTTDASSYAPGWSSAGYQGGPDSKLVSGGKQLFSGIGNFVKEHPYLTAAGVGGTAYLLANQGKSLTQPNYLPTYTPPTAASYGLGRTLSSSYMPTRPMAEGGIAALADGGRLQNSPANVDFMHGDMYPQSQIQRSYYATPTQMPTSAQQTAASYEPKTNPLTGELTANMATGGVASGDPSTPAAPIVPAISSNPLYHGITAAGNVGTQTSAQSTTNPMYIQQLAHEFNTTPEIAQKGLQALQNVGITKASGGSVGSKYNLGSYSDGGRLLKGPGDGMSDNIPASIADKQPARLADGEFVVPADVVSHLGNGSTDAGAKHLYKMMDNVRKARTGRKAQGKQIKADKYLPK